ncbi:MAG TPA: hypothetical protein VNO84_01455 [Burkholderiaceae bacterium]|nr:hypothetical protein [Burkholderiaceae bacterium]
MIANFLQAFAMKHVKQLAFAASFAVLGPAGIAGPQEVPGPDNHDDPASHPHLACG